MLSCTEEEVEALFYFISNLYLTPYPIRTLSIPFPNFTAVHGVEVAQAKPACKHTIATRKCYQYNTIQQVGPVSTSSAKSIYSSKRFTIKMYNIASVKLIRNIKFIINIQVKNYATCS